MEMIILSSLEKVFYDEKPTVSEFRGFSMLKNERSSFQAAFLADENCELTVKLSGELSNKAKVYLVKDVPVGRACPDDSDDFYLRKVSGDYPDYLLPVEGKIKAEKGKWQSIWVEIMPDGKTGKSSLEIKLYKDEEKLADGKIDIEVIASELPKQELIYTSWFHCDGICNYYNVEPFTDDFWRICKNYVKTAVDHGMNCILTPLFTPPLDTAIGGERRTTQLVKVKKSGGKYVFNFANLRKWISVCRECGIEYFEMSHLFTQWGAKHAPKIIATDRKGREKKIFGWETETKSKPYNEFLRLFAPELIKVIESEGIREKCLFHVSDEPPMRDLGTYKERAKLINEVFSGFKVIDALSEIEFYETGAVKQPIPAEDYIENFIGKVPELWTYYCCSQGYDNMPNRFISMPSVRNRILGIIMYKYDIKGFLQWGYNFYNTQYSKKAINPYEITDAGGAFSSGDSFVVYPGENGEAIASLRLKVFYDGFEDIMALKLLESKIGREKTVEFIEKDLVKPISFTEYPHESEWLLEMREKINRKIKEN